MPPNNDVIEHEVWARKPDQQQAVHVITMAQRDWQLAEKLAGYLEDKGYVDVEVRTIWLTFLVDAANKTEVAGDG